MDFHASTVLDRLSQSADKRDFNGFTQLNQDTDEKEDNEFQPHLISIESIRISDLEETEFIDSDVSGQYKIECESHSPKSRRQVSFSTVEIRKYPIILGDHPDCSSGPPISIGWDYSDSIEVSLNLFEEMRPPRRHRRELVLPFRLRRELISKNCGYEEDQIRERLSEMKIVKKERQQTLAKLKYQKLEEVFESIKGSTNLMKGLRRKLKTTELSSISYNAFQQKSVLG